MSNRVLNRIRARELSREEVETVTGAGTGCRGTMSHFNNSADEDFLCDPN